jgi:hypothetical protein
MNSNLPPMMDGFLPSIEVSFILSGVDNHLDEITTKLQIEPSKTRTKDDYRAPYYPPEIVLTCDWDLSTGKINERSIDVLFLILMGKLKGKEGVINKLCSDYALGAYFVVIVHAFDAREPALILTRDIVAFAASINAEISFDVYVYPPGYVPGAGVPQKHIS